MTIRATLFLLFLYLLLVWVLCLLLFRGDPDQILTHGLLWCAIGIAALLVGLVLKGILTWRREHAGQSKSTPPAQEVPSVQVAPKGSDETNWFAVLVREAQDRLGRAASGPRRLQDLPVYLLVGLEGSGKTSVFHNAGIDAQPLSGQILGGGEPVVPTREANLWLANDCLFVELGGKAFSNTPTRLAEMLGILRPASQMKRWRNLFSAPESADGFRGVVLCFDARSLLSDDRRKSLSLDPMPPDLLEQQARGVRERLLAIAETFGVQYPAYALFTNTDAIPFFTEFFDRLPDADANQPFGVLASPSPGSGEGREQVWADAETKRLTKDFNSVFLCLSARRMVSLSQESVAARKQAIYEFPREFKRIRSPLVQFLVDVFRPDSLRLNPVLRGFFFTGTRKVERGVERPLEKTQEVIRGNRRSMEATRIFRSEGTQTDDPAQKARPLPTESASGLTEKWVFANSFFQQVLTHDHPLFSRGPSVSAVAKRYGQLAVACATAIMVIAFFVLTVSWLGNRELINSVEAAVRTTGNTSAGPNASLQALDNLRQVLVDTLDKPAPLRLTWGLYVGQNLREGVRKAYYDGLRRIILEPVNTQLVQRLANVDVSHPAQDVFPQLKTHLTISAPGCPVDPPVISRTLNQSFEGMNPNADKDLVDRQVSFYVKALAADNPVPLARDSMAVENARRYLEQSTDAEPVLSQILAEIRNGKHLSLTEVVPNYRQVLDAPDEISFEFTRKGAEEFSRRTETNLPGPRDQCVFPVSEQLKNGAAQVGNMREVRSLYYAKYKDYWKDFLKKCRVKSYESRPDAAKKLDTLSDSSSPLLGLVQFVSKNTFFPPSPVVQGLSKAAVDSGSGILGRIGLAKPLADAATKKVESRDLRQEYQSDDINRVFQPAHQVTPPTLERLVSDSNQRYVTALRDLGLSVKKYEEASQADQPQLVQSAHGALEQASLAQKGLADGFNTDTENVNGQLSDLLQQPIRNAGGLFPANAEKATAGEKDGDLARLCLVVRPVLSKYPFNPQASASLEASLQDLQKFAPNGDIWAFQQKALGEYLVKEAPGQWAPKATPAGPQVSREMLDFLNRAQQVTNAFFPSGGQQPSLEYSLRAAARQEDVGIKLEIDGATYNSRGSGVRAVFRWPAASESAQGARGFLREGPGDPNYPFGKNSGLWGVFRLFQHAEQRPLNAKVVNWSQVQGIGGEIQPLPIPAKVEFVDFPNGFDLFNPLFFEHPLQCPKHALTP